MCYMDANAVGVRELRQNLSVYLDQVKEGRTYTVTEHGRAVAELRPVTPAADPVARLVSSGVVRRSSRGPADLPRPVTLRGRKSLSQALDDARGDRF